MHPLQEDRADGAAVEAQQALELLGHTDKAWAQVREDPQRASEALQKLLALDIPARSPQASSAPSPWCHAASVHVHVSCPKTKGFDEGCNLFIL